MRLIRLIPILVLAALAMVAAACGSESTATPTSTPAISSTSTPMPTESPMMGETPMPTESPMMGETPMPTESPMMGETPMPTDSPMMGKTFDLVSGWYEGREVRYYDFGMNSPVMGGMVETAPIYVFITGFDGQGNPMFLEGQHNIVTTVPGEEGYSDLWRVMLVMAPEDYVADSITSKAGIDEAGYEIMPTDMYVNCPIVPEGSELEGGEPLVQGWHDGEEVYYPDFGMNPTTTAPIWAFITGFDDQGNPMFVEGQHNVINVVPGQAGYSAFWSVNLVMVPEGYEADSIKDVDGIGASGYEIVQPGLVVNCPVTFVAAS